MLASAAGKDTLQLFSAHLGLMKPPLYNYETSKVMLHVFPVSPCLSAEARTVWGLVGAEHKVLTWCLTLWPKRKACGWGWSSAESEKDTAWHKPVSDAHKECMGQQCIPMGMLGAIRWCKTHRHAIWSEQKSILRRVTFFLLWTESL